MEPWQIIGVLAGIISSLAGLVYKGQKDVIADRDRQITDLKAENVMLRTEAKETVQAQKKENERLWQLLQSRTPSEPRP